MINDIQIIQEKVQKTPYLFFDLDGVLIDTEKLYFRFWKEASKYYGYELKDEEALCFRSLEVESGRLLMKQFSNGLLDYNIVKEKRIALMNDYFLNHPIEVKDSAFSLLNSLKTNNHRIIIVTANAIDKAASILKETGLDKYVDEVISAKDVKRGKPYPDVYKYALKKLSTTPSEVIVFEDSPNGLKAAHGAHCFTIMVKDLTPYEKGMTYVDAYIENLKSLL